MSTFSDLIHCTNEPNVSIPHLANLLIERSQSANWVVVLKSLITTHHLLAHGNEVSSLLSNKLNWRNENSIPRVSRSWKQAEISKLKKEGVHGLIWCWCLSPNDKSLLFCILYQSLCFYWNKKCRFWNNIWKFSPTVSECLLLSIYQGNTWFGTCVLFLRSKMSFFCVTHLFCV